MAFATAEDVATRLARDLTAEQGAQAEFLLDIATAVIAGACGKDDAWAAALTPVPDLVMGMCVELVVRVMSNPTQARSMSEQLGQYQHSESFRDAAQGGGMLLAPWEELAVRNAVFGRTTASVRVKAVVNDPCVICGLFPGIYGGLCLGCDSCGS